MKLEEIKPHLSVHGLVPNLTVTIINAEWYGTDTVSVTYQTPQGPDQQILDRSDEHRLSAATERPWSFTADGSLFRLVAEAYRIQLAHLFDPLLAVHTSLIDPLPHQISAVYDVMLNRQPLRFLLADDPGAGKTIMAGLLIKELLVRGDVKRCLIVAPGNLVEQWQDEMLSKFHLAFTLMTNENLVSAASGNWFLENNLMIARLDKLARNEDIQTKLLHTDGQFDLVIFDEAHKCAAHYFGGETNYTKRYQLAAKLSAQTRHLLLMTATPHNGKDDDFQLFMALLDHDRFEGKSRGRGEIDINGLMRRMVKEKLLTFEGKPLFPERIAYTVPYHLSPGEAELYAAVTDYVRTEFDRAKSLKNNKRKGTVGFALTNLQRRLASSPEAIYTSLHRRHDRLERRLQEVQALQQRTYSIQPFDGGDLDDEELSNIDDTPDDERETLESSVVDQATAAQTIEELRLEIDTLRELTRMALRVRSSGRDTKWQELSHLLNEIFSPDSAQQYMHQIAKNSGHVSVPTSAMHQKLVIFTEHRDTLNYLTQHIGSLLGRPQSVVTIHGAMRREERQHAQDSFLQDKTVQVLIATDAAGEGINLQRAHLMINYDMPWNPNRLEQRFGRIHRIKQTEVCFLWNLVSIDTREGEVYKTLLDKLNEAKRILGGQVFDVLGKLLFQDGSSVKSLRDLLIEAVQYGNHPDVRARMQQVIDHNLDTEAFRRLIENDALIPEAMHVAQVEQIRSDMERAEARKLQPHFISDFFRAAFTHLGGTIRHREQHRYEITHVPAALRQYPLANGGHVLPRYERITFEKERITLTDAPLAAYVYPGHPLLDVVLHATLARYRDLLTQGAVLVDEQDTGTQARVLFLVEHTLHDASVSVTGERRSISKRVLYIEMHADGHTTAQQNAPYLDYRPLQPHEPALAHILDHPACHWITRESEQQALRFAIAHIVPQHRKEVSDRRLAWIHKTRQAVDARLNGEMMYWDRRANQLAADERAGKAGARLNSHEARRRADELEQRRQHRLAELDREAQISAAKPILSGGLLVVPIGLLRQLHPDTSIPPTPPHDTQAAAARARQAVMQIEAQLGHHHIVDRELERIGYDIESIDGQTGHVRMIEVKGRIAGADVITVTKNEIMTALNRPEHYILALVEFTSDGGQRVRYVRRPFAESGITTDFNGTSVNFPFADLLNRAQDPA